MSIGLLRRFVPGSLKKRLRLFLVRFLFVEGEGDNEFTSPPIKYHLGRCSHTPWVGRRHSGTYSFNAAPLKASGSGEGLPVPTGNLRMWYSEDSDEEFLQSGEAAARSIRNILGDNGITLDENTGFAASLL